MIIVTAKQQREIENNCSATISKADLMDAAGSLSAEYINSNYGVSGKSVAILSGSGCNGGDGRTVFGGVGHVLIEIGDL